MKRIGRPEAKRPRSGPRIEVEPTVSQVVSPKLLEWAEDADKAAARVHARADAEAVHDLRVSLRRSRSLLRIVRPVYGWFYVDVIRRELGKVADATGALRDEEVLAKTLAKLELSKAGRAGLGTWATKRQHREKALRTSVVRLLLAGTLSPPLAYLRALIALPRKPDRDREARRFARQVVFEAQAEVDDCRAADTADVVGMHNLRIAYKRMRYAIEAFMPMLPPELRAWKDVASKFQSVLGDLHDHDVAIDVISRASSIEEPAREEILSALRATREGLAAHYRELAGHEVMMSFRNPA